jgi:hypothetical protein
MTTSSGAPDLPSYLSITDPPEGPEATSLQVLLLTGELAMQRQRMTLLAEALATIARLLRLPGDGLTDE